MSFPALQKYLVSLHDTLQAAGRRCVRLLFNRVESETVYATLNALAASAGQTILAQGFLWDLPAASLAAPEFVSKPIDVSPELALQANASTGT
ncbi:MAG: hypothetical protein ACOH2B_03720 [Burkholderiaceae bacterium]